LKSESESEDGSTGRVETVIFDRGIFTLPFVNLTFTRSSIVNIIGCGED
jgi:hypothetical protein